MAETQPKTQNKNQPTNQPQNEVGTYCWNELMTRDIDKARSILGTLFGWKAEEMDMGPDGKYTVFKVGNKQVAGAMPINAPQFAQQPVGWMGYVYVNDADTTTRQAESLGVKVQVPPTEIPNVGRFAVYNHPALGTFAVLGPNKR